MASPVLPISIIGPDPIANRGSTSTTAIRPDEVHKEEGPKAVPSPMIPPEIKLSEYAEQQLKQYLDAELSICRNERFEFVNRLARFKEKYRTKFPEFPKDWPIANASQIVVPVIKTAVHTLSARIYQTLMAAEPPAAIRTEDKDYQDFAFDYEKFLSLYLD